MASISLVLDVIEAAAAFEDNALVGWAAWLDAEALRAAGNGCESRVAELATMRDALGLVLNARGAK